MQAIDNIPLAPPDGAIFGGNWFL